jgi:peptidoglycan/xylan/chitin deacetylase (PgdA/CDA1 family)
MLNKAHLPSRATKLFISLVFFAGVMLRRASTRMFGGTPAATCVILYYHSIEPQYRQAFAKQMETVLRLTTPIDAEHVPKLSPGRYYSAITFDDGFQDAVENAVPELVCRGIHAIFFITADALGKPADWWPVTAPERTRNIATAEELRLVLGEWISVGAHTMTHARLSSLEESDARREILESRRRLESLLKSEILSLSFPYGDFDENTVRLCREAGYEHAFTTQHKKAFEEPESFLVGRVKAEPTDWRLEFRLKLLGGYQWLPHAIALKRRLLRNSAVSRIRLLGSFATKSADAQG